MEQMPTLHVRMHTTVMYEHALPSADHAQVSGHNIMQTTGAVIERIPRDEIQTGATEST